MSALIGNNMSKTSIIGIACFLVIKLGAMELDLSILPDGPVTVDHGGLDLFLHDPESYPDLYQVHSLNQVGGACGSLAGTACGYYALNNCIQIMDALMPANGNPEKKSKDTDPIIKEFETINSPQRKAMIKMKTIEEIKKLINLAFSDNHLETKEESKIRLLITEMINEVSRTSDPVVSNPPTGEGKISWTFTKKDLKRSYRPEEMMRGFKCVEEIVSDDWSDSKNSSENTMKKFIAFIGERISKEVPGIVSFNDGNLEFSFSGQSKMFKNIAYGNWLDTAHLASLIEIINLKREQESKKKLNLAALNMAGDFQLYLKDYLQSAGDEQTKLPDEETKLPSSATIIEQYEYVNYGPLKELKEKLYDGTGDPVIVGFMIHTVARSPLEQALSDVMSAIRRKYFSKYVSKDVGNHWISLVVVRSPGEVWCRYYVADSFNNQDQRDSEVISDIIEYLENIPERRKGSQFDHTIDLPSWDRVDTLSSTQSNTEVLKKVPSREKVRGGGRRGQEENTPSGFISSGPLALGILGLGGFVLSSAFKEQTNKKTLPVDKKANPSTKEATTKKKHSNKKHKRKKVSFEFNEPLSIEPVLQNNI